jgi:proline dehydrogenase
MGIARQLLLKGSESRWLSDRLSRRAFVQRAVTRFMPGEELESAVDAADSMVASGITSILTLLGENVGDAAAAEEVVSAYEEILGRVSDRGLDAYISVKPTHLGLDLGLDVAHRNVERVVEESAARNRFVAVDMESSAYVEPTLDLFRRLRERYENVGLCLQSYLYRTPGDLESLLPLRPMIRLVKGAYKEPADLAYPRKTDVDEAFLRLSDRLLEAVAEGEAQAAFGTHDMGLIKRVRERAVATGVEADAYEIQMLYGIQREAQARLARDGHRVRVLISYGEYWFPWYMRRLAERPANVLFVLRNAFAR